MVRAGATWKGGDPRQKQGYVWTSEIGTPIGGWNFVRRHFHPLCKRAGIPTGRLPDGRRGFRFHDMRHSTASIMAARGERPEVIQRVMRHAKVSFTVIRIPIKTPTPSASGKTLVVASTRGNQKLALQIDGKDLYLGLNAYLYAEPKGR